MQLELARLVGAYHAHKAAGGEHYTKWFNGLDRQQLVALASYRRHGVMVFEQAEPKEPPSMADAFAGIVFAFANFGMTAQRAFAGIAAGMAEPVAQLAQQINQLAKDLDQVCEQSQRLDLFDRLVARGLPEPIADAIAQHCPTPWLPDNLPATWSRVKYDVGHWVRKAPCRLGWHSWLELELDGQPARHCLECGRFYGVSK